MWNKDHVACVWTQMYCIALFLVFPLYYQNSYINILESKTGFFIISSLVYLVGCIAIMLPPIFIKRGKKIKEEKNIEKEIKFSFVDIFSLLFLISILLSVVLADNPREVILGINGRLFGAAVLLLCIVLYYCFSRYFRWNTVFFWCCLVGIGIVGILAILNRFVIDPLGMYKAIDSAQIPEYLSTIGQINILSGYLCGFFPFLCGLFLYSEKMFSRLLYGIGTVIVFTAGICSNSDSFFIAIAITVLFYFTTCLNNKEKLSDWFLLMGVWSAAMLMIKIVSVGKTLSVWRQLQKQWIYEIPWLVMFIVFVCMGFILKKEWNQINHILEKVKKGWIIVLVIALTSLFLYVFAVNVFFSESEQIFAKKWILFCDEWGTNRGYVWKRSIELFFRLPLKSQIFGIGPGEFSHFFEEYFIDSISKFGYYFEDAHNEFLQLLVTTGIVGVVGYMGMIISSIIFCIKEKTDMSIILIAVFLVWVIQGSVNNLSVFVTPYLFVFMGIAQRPWKA